MSGLFSGNTQDSVFGNSSVKFGQSFGSSPNFGVSRENLFAQSTQDGGSLFATTGQTPAGSVFGGSEVQKTPAGSVFGGSEVQKTSSGSLFGGSEVQKTSSAAASSSQNLFTQLSSNVQPFTTTSSAFGGASVFGGAKLFASAPVPKESKSFSPSSLFRQSKPASQDTASQSQSLPTVFGKDAKQTGLFGKSSSAAGSSSLQSAPQKSWLLFGKQVGDQSIDSSVGTVTQRGGDATTGGETNPPSTLFGKPMEERPLSEAEESEEKTTLFGKPQAEGGEESRSRRKPFIKRSERGAARSIFSKAVTVATGIRQQDEKEASLDDPDRPPAKVTRVRKSSDDEPPSSRRLSRSHSTTEEVSQRRALVCKDVPSSINNALLLKKHFSKFGNVSKVFPSPAKRTATIHFKTHEEAAKAKKMGREIDEGQAPLKIFWSAFTSTAATSKTSSSKTTVTARSSRGSFGRSEVEDELASMAGLPTHTESYRAVERPKERSRSKAQPSRRPKTPTSSPSRAISPTPQATSSDSVTKVSLETLMISTKNTLDKYLLLDNRDKILKQGRKKQSDLSTAVAVQGTCPDMCYEKERYDRDAKRRLSIYEIVAGTENVAGQNPQVDHARAVKEYSRSSADQEEPLSHEMRPGPVLDMTMTYLLTKIADKGEESTWLDWYDFLWNRTRGIRKDITQQMLCDRTAVALIEKCARFHIYCAERLSEEDFHTFDQKINTENLTKSLQSLKELYADLGSKHQTFCDTEAEFRAYMVLLNLNQGDTLREVQQLRPEVRESPELDYAIQVYSALSSNNYVRFFKLVKRGTFLTGCILHRYFVQVRSRALKTILRAYTAGGRPVQYPLIELVRVLGFEDLDEAAEFCVHYGLTAMAGEVLLDRGSYIEPEVSLSLRRAVGLVESKLNVSVGEVINGGPLPPVSLPPPQISFDERGHYIGEIPTVEASSQDVEKKVPQSDSTTTVHQHQAMAPEVPVKPPKPAVPNELVKEVARHLFLEVIDEFSKEISTNCHAAIQTYLASTSTDLWDGLYEDVSRPIIKHVCEDVVETQLQQKRREEEIMARMAQRERVARAEMEVMVDEVVTAELTNIATVQVREVEARLKAERQERCVLVLGQEILGDVVTSLLQEAADDVYETDVVKRLQQLDDLKQSVELYHVAKFWQRWKRAITARLRMKRTMLTFPSAPPTDTLNDLVDNLIPERGEDRIHNGAVYISDKAKLQIQRPLLAVEQRRRLDISISLRTLVTQLRQVVAWSPLNLGDIMGRQLVQALRAHTPGKVKPIERIYWKLLVSLPTAPESDINNTVFCDWIRSKFTKGVVPDVEEACDKLETVALYSMPLKVSQRPVSQLATCVKVIQGTLQEKEVEMVKDQRGLLGSAALVFALPPIEDDTDEYWMESHQRLVRILEAKPLSPSLPLVIVLPERGGEFPSMGKVYDMLSLVSLIQEELVSSVHIVSLEYSPLNGVDVASQQTANKLETALRWLAEHYRPPPELRPYTLSVLVEETLSSEFYTPVLYNLQIRKKQGRLHQNPNVLIELYNSVILYLEGLVTSPGLRTHSWPVAEFTVNHRDLPRPYWNSEDHLGYVSETLQALGLPAVEFQEVESDSWEQACQDVWEFAHAVVSSTEDEQPQHPQFLSRIRSLLQRCEAAFTDTCFLAEGEWTCEPTYINMPWTDIVMAAIDYKLLSTSFYDPNQDTDELLVVHCEKCPDDFQPPIGWKMAQSDRETNDSVSLRSTICHAAERKRHLTKDEDSIMSKKACSETTNNLEKSKSSTFDAEPLPENTVLATAASNSLKEVLEQEKHESDKFEEFLRKALNSSSEVFPTETQSISMQNVSPLIPSKTLNLSTGSVQNSQLAEEEMDVSNSSKPRYSDYSLTRKYSPTIQEGLETLKQEIASTKLSNELFEMRLRNMLQH